MSKSSKQSFLQANQLLNFSSSFLDDAAKKARLNLHQVQGPIENPCNLAKDPLESLMIDNAEIAQASYLFCRTYDTVGPMHSTVEAETRKAQSGIVLLVWSTRQ